MFSLLLLGCGSSEEKTEDVPANHEAVIRPPNTPIENRVAAPVPDQRSPEAAQLVLRDYFAAIADRRYANAYRLWSDRGRASGISEAEFARGFQPYRTFSGIVGAPGRMESGAGSSYVDIPVTVTGRARNGASFRQVGTFTLRRANDVPGATPEQLLWRIYKTDLQLGQTAADYRFVGRWATEEGNCATRAWVFTASSLKTPASAVCSFSRVSEVPGGYDIVASCMANGPARDDRLLLRFAESARALLVETRTIGDAGLVACK